MLTLAVALVLAPPSWSQKTPDGTTVKLVAVSNLGTKKSWTPDGAAQKVWMVPDALKQVYGGSPDKQLSFISNFVCQLTPTSTSGVPSVTFKIGDRSLGLGYVLRDLKNPKLWWAGAGVDNRKLPRTVDLRVGVGVGKWKATSMHNLQSGESKGPKFFGFILRDIKLVGANQKVIALDCSIPKTVAGKMAYQIKVFDSSGSALSPAGSGPMKPGQPARYFFVDSGRRLVHADLLTQPYKWLTFKGVRTKPK